MVREMLIALGRFSNFTITASDEEYLPETTPC